MALGTERKTWHATTFTKWKPIAICSPTGTHKYWDKPRFKKTACLYELAIGGTDGDPIANLRG
jgi:hypothetical protein